MTAYNRTGGVGQSIIAAPPAQYDHEYFAQVVILLNLQFRQINNPGELRGSTLVLTDLPTSATGLPSGSVWRDAANANVLKVVP